MQSCFRSQNRRGRVKVLPVLDDRTALHLANRLGFGPAPGDLDHIKKLGFDGYLEEQLNPKPSELPAALQAQLTSLPCFGKDTFEIYRDHWWRLRIRSPSGEKLAREQISLIKTISGEVGPQVRMARMARAIASPWRLHEALVDFWYNHFNVYERKQLDRIWTGPYEEEAIRSHTLSKFKDLLFATAKHPAMLVYLDNWHNVAAGSSLRKANGINENYAREVMELHTLGVDGGYTQSDVTALAHILTGWNIGFERRADHSDSTDWDDDMGRVRGGFAFVPRLHDTSPQTFMGKKFGNRDQADGEAALRLLAEHPSTAKHISYKLAQYFVADQPSSDLVHDMSHTFQTTNGDIKAVLRVMFTSKAFRDPQNMGRKFKTPYQYVVSMARLTGFDTRNAAPLGEELKVLGQPLYGCVTPDGYACTESAWLDPDAMMRRLSFAVKFGSGAYMQAYLAHVGYGAMSRGVRLQRIEGGTPLNADKLIAAAGLELSGKTRSAVAQAATNERAGLILGSPEFMRS
jgi:uncharacterized protein (DUF1800 family)